MIIQDDYDLLNYVNAKLHPLAPEPGSFLKHFLEACQRADHTNYPLLRPALLEMKRKYPADTVRLRMEEEG